MKACNGNYYYACITGRKQHIELDGKQVVYFFEVGNSLKVGREFIIQTIPKWPSLPPPIFIVSSLLSYLISSHHPIPYYFLMMSKCLKPVSEVVYLLCTLYFTSRYTHFHDSNSQQYIALSVGCIKFNSLHSLGHFFVNGIFLWYFKVQKRIKLLLLFSWTEKRHFLIFLENQLL